MKAFVELEIFAGSARMLEPEDWIDRVAESGEVRWLWLAACASLQQFLSSS